MIDFKEAKEFMCPNFESRYNEYIRYCLSQVKNNGLWLEFGVCKGQSTQKIVSMMPDEYKPLYGFDSFEGLPEDWWGFHKKGAFNVNGKVPIIEGVEMVKGWFRDTLPSFLSTHKDDISLLIVDCDIYSSTKDIFDNCGNRIKRGTIIMFDEYYNYADWDKHEHKAFMEFVERYDVKYEWVARVTNGEQCACRITEIKE
jgi:predicted O-methyltransferase YrrM